MGTMRSWNNGGQVASLTAVSQLKAAESLLAVQNRKAVSQDRVPVPTPILHSGLITLKWVKFGTPLFVLNVRLQFLFFVIVSCCFFKCFSLPEPLSTRSKSNSAATLLASVAGWHLRLTSPSWREILTLTFYIFLPFLAAQAKHLWAILSASDFFIQLFSKFFDWASKVHSCPSNFFT